MRKKEFKQRIEQLEAQRDGLLSELEMIRIPRPEEPKTNISTMGGTILYYMTADLKALVKFAHPYYAGPLFYYLLHSMMAIACLRYGFSHPKRSFENLLRREMALPAPLIELLYECRKHQKFGTFPRGTAIQTWKSPRPLFIADRYGEELPDGIGKDRLVINVTALSELFVDVIEGWDMENSSYSLPIDGKKAAKILIQAIESVKENNNVSENGS